MKDKNMINIIIINMNLRSLITIYMIVFHYWKITRTSIMNKIGNIKTIYILEDGNLKNATLRYYLDTFMKDDLDYNLFVRIRDVNGVHSIGYRGKLSSVKNIEIKEYTHLPRKIFSLSNGNEHVNFDLNELDNYWRHTIEKGSNAITKMTDILIMFGIKADTINMFNPPTFEKTSLDISTLDIKDLYS